MVSPTLMAPPAIVVLVCWSRCAATEKWHENNLPCLTVYGFENAVYNVGENERLDTRFLFPAKGEESDVEADLVITGIITAEAAGTSGKQYLAVLMSSTIIFACRR